MADYIPNEQKLSTPAEAETRILNSIHEHVIYYDREMKILWANSAALNSAEISLEKIKNQHCWSIYAQRETPCDNCPVIMAMDTDSVRCIEKTTADGRSWVVKGYPLKDKRGNIIGAIGTTLDITIRKKTEETLRESEGKVNAMLTSIADHMSMMDRDLNIRWANDIAKQMFGEDLVGKKCYQAYHGRETPCEPYPCVTLKAFEDEQSHSHETEVIDQNGQTRYFHCTANVALRDENNQPLTVMEISRDITQQKLMEKALKESEKKYRQIYDNLLDAYYEASIDGIILEISPSIENFSKYKREDLIGKSLYQLYTNPDERDGLVQRIIRDGRVNEYELHLTDKDGAQLICSINTMLVKDDKGKPHKLVGVVRDISERKRVEKEKKELKERLVRSQKMESLGLLAGGVAHDLNNVLSGIVSYPDLLLMDLPEDSRLRKPILTIQKSGQKAADIVQDLLTLARRGVNTAEVLNLNDIILDYLKSHEYHQLLNYYPALSVETSLENALLNIKGSPIHLKKAIMNLVSNAAEAQPSGGKIVISTHNEYVDVSIKKYEEIIEGDYALLKISDNGMGIANEDLSRIFEPFYSKKIMGRSGTGLGMAVVWGSIQDHNGYINIESKEGEGTTFYLYFPVTREKPAKEKDFILIEDYMGNNESILVVDDIEEQREIATVLLTRLNYSVSAVSSGEAALEYLKTNTADLLLLDMIMDPGIDGLDTFKKIIANYPQQKAIIASGFSETGRVKEAQKLGAGQYIKKPYTLEKIGIAVKEELSK